MEKNESKQLTPQKRTLIFLCLVVSGIASSTLSTAMTTALPNLVESFGVSTSIGQWVTSGYSLAMGMIMPLTAFLITRFPTKRLYLTGIGGFLVGLLLSIFAGNFAVMMVGRILQACGNGILMSAAQVIILTVYPPEKKGTMMGSSVMMPLYVQNVMGYSAAVSGLVTLPGSLATAVVSPFAGRLYDKMGIKKIFIVGSAALVISNLGMFFLTTNTPLWVAAGLNVIRNISIGSLMMPLLTWGTTNVSVKKVADASSLLTSFRTIAGSIGSAVFVGIMTTVSANSEAVYGDQAMMHGMNVSFLWMTVGALVLFLISVFGVKNKSQNYI